MISFPDPTLARVASSSQSMTRSQNPSHANSSAKQTESLGMEDPAPRTGALRLAVIGTGYVGLVTGACLASLGHSVECIDQDVRRVSQLRRGEVPFYEPGLASLLADCGAADGSNGPALRFATPEDASLSQADVVFLAVGTPTAADGHSADLRALKSAAGDAARTMRPEAVLVIKSTSPVGTGDEIARLVERELSGSGVAVASNPEFLREGRAVEDFLAPSRIVIGTVSRHAEDVLKQVYAPLTSRGAPLLSTTRRSAELIKYASNSFLAAKLAFINEMADLCDRLDADIEAVSHGMGLDSRIGPQYLQAGPGHGGSCLPKDLLALAHTGRQAGMDLQMVQAVLRVNDSHHLRMVDKIVAACDGHVEGKILGFLGVAFKPGTDDVRESPALALISESRRRGAHVRATDPQALANAIQSMPTLEGAADAYACAEGADVLVLTTEWDEYRTLDLERLRSLMRGNGLVDLRNFLSAEAARSAGFAYFGVGRGGVQATVDEAGRSRT